MGSFLLKLQTLPTIYYISVHVGDKRVCNHNCTEHDISILHIHTLTITLSLHICCYTRLHSRTINLTNGHKMNITTFKSQHHSNPIVLNLFTSPQHFHYCTSLSASCVGLPQAQLYVDIWPAVAFFLSKREIVMKRRAEEKKKKEAKQKVSKGESE